MIQIALRDSGIEIQRVVIQRDAVDDSRSESEHRVAFRLRSMDGKMSLPLDDVPSLTDDRLTPPSMGTRRV